MRSMRGFGRRDAPVVMEPIMMSIMCSTLLSGKFTWAHVEKLVGCLPAVLFASAIRSSESEPK